MNAQTPSWTRALWPLVISLAASLLLAAPAHAAPGVQLFLTAPQKAAETPRMFIERVSHIYDDESPLFPQGLQPPAGDAQPRIYAEFYDPQFAKLIDDNFKLAGKRFQGEDVDTDPVCQCQGYSHGFRIKSIGQRPGGFTDVRIAGDKSDDVADYTLVLRRMAGAWKIYDVIDTGGSVRALLTRHNACMRTTKTDAALNRCM